MVTALFKNLLATGLSMVPVIAVLTLIAPLLEKRYAPRLRHLLWLAVAARLVVPVSLQEAASLVIPAGKPIYYLQRDSAAVAAAFADLSQGTQEAALLSAGAQSPALSWMGIGAAVWLSGACIYLTVHLLAYARMNRRLRRWSLPAQGRAVQVLDEEMREMGLSGKIGLYSCCEAPGPMLTGLLRPRIILPDSQVDEHALRAALRHEISHWHRRDLWSRVLILVATAVHWFNPAVHWMARRSELDMELACDDWALRNCSPRARREYGLAVLSFVHPESGESWPLTTSFLPAKEQLARRFRSIRDDSRKRGGGPALCALLALVLIGGALIGCGELAAPERDETAMPAEASVDAVQVATPEWDEAGEGQPAPESSELPVQDIFALEEYWRQNPEAVSEQMARLQAEMSELYIQLSTSDNPYGGGEMMWPVPGYYAITSAYGWRFGGSDFHTGMDISGAEIYGAPVISAAAGTVVLVNKSYTPGAGYGCYVIVDHGGGVTTLYGQLSDANVKVGDAVMAGQRIAQVGSTGFSTGPHLHFEVRENGVHVNPVTYFLENSGR